MVRRLPVIQDEQRIARQRYDARGGATQGAASLGDEMRREAMAPRDTGERLSLKEAVEIAGTLGHPSKMPGFSYGISATLCITGSQLRKIPGSVCASCYALTDWYRSWKPLLYGHARRERGIRHRRWVDAMVMMIDKYCVDESAYFRWHDSGDLRGLWHLANIVEVCRRTPNVRHWLPTREYELVSQFLATGKTIPDNLVIRLSAHMIDADPVVPLELCQLPTSTVSSAPQRLLGVQIVEGKGSVECRAVEARDNRCGSCRACWDGRVRNVNYPVH